MVRIFKAFKKRYRKWKIWRKYTWYGTFRQLLILFNIENDNFYFNNFAVLEEKDNG